MSHDFSRELEALAKLSRAFSAAYPALAPGLAAPSDDPDVERLIDGFGFLVKQVEELVDSAAKNAADPFGSLLGPELLRPFPCATILETAADRPIEIPAGSEFESVPVEGTRCRFRAFSASRVIPWEIADAKLVWAQDRGQTLRIVLRRRLQQGNQVRSMTDTLGSLFPLRLHIAGEPRASFATLLALSTVEAIDVNVGDAAVAERGPAAGDKTLRMNGSALRTWGLDAKEALLPPEPWEHPGFRLLREYFLLPSKFAFVEIAPPDDASTPMLAAPIPDGSQVVLTLRLGRSLPANLSVGRESFRTNCVPVINVFETTAEPVRPTIERVAHTLRIAGHAPDHGEVYTVLSASGWCGHGRDTLAIPPLTDFEAVSQLEKTVKDKVFYALGKRTRANGNAQKEDVTVRFVLPREVPEWPPVKSVSFDLLASNRELPMSLGVGDVKVPGARTPKQVVFRNITAVTPYRAPPGGRASQRRALAMVAASACSRRDVDVLKTLLHLLNLHTTVNGPAGLTALRRIRAVVGVSHASALVSGERGMRQGQDIDLRLDETSLDGEGDAFVFAQVLARLFAHDAKINSFARTRARLEGTGRVVSLPARSGDETI